MKEHCKLISDRIAVLGNEEKARWLENYVKHGIKSRGVGIPKIREVVKDVAHHYLLNERAMDQQTLLLGALMEEDFAEDKLAAIIFMQLYWKEVDTGVKLKVVSRWFDAGLIYDWNVCDWLCVRILTPLVAEDPDACIKQFTEWNNDHNVWKARASLVPFAQSKTITAHLPTISQFSKVLIRREERFSKTAVGWVMREVSRIDPGFVRSFLQEHEEWTSKEVERNAMKYLQNRE